MKIKFLLAIFLFVFINRGSALNTDSLYQKIKYFPDSAKVIELNNFAQQLYENHPEIALKFTSEALSLSQKNNLKPEQIKSLFLMGVIHRKLGKIDQSLSFHLKSLEIAELINDNYFIASNFNNLGIIYKNQNDFKKAMEYYEKALEIQRELDNKKGMASLYSNIGVIFTKEKNFDKAIEMYKLSLETEHLLEDYHAVAGSLCNIGSAYWHKSDLKSAIKYYKMSLKLYDEYQDKYNKALILNNLGIIYSDLKEYSTAVDYCNSSISIAREIKDLSSVHYNYMALSEIYSRTRDFEKAYHYHLLSSQTKDSLISESSSKKIIELQQKYESDKREQEILVLTKEKELQDLELNKKRVIIYAFTGSFIVVLLLGIIVYKENRQKHYTNKKLKKAYSNIEEKNKDITDSINYAKRIQEALLKDEEHISENLPAHFILYKPKDILSGDFYWSLEKNGYLYLAVSDCTGHGVPGAMMSMLGIAYLNEITNGEQLLEPSEILNKLREKIVKELNQHGKVGESKDGMDISIIRLDLLTKELQWAGANNPLYIINEKVGSQQSEEKSIIKTANGLEYGNLQLIEIKPNKQPIGFHPNPTPFTNHRIQLKSNSFIYLLTDGFADQFGGPKGKKMKYAQLKKILFEFNSKSMAEQKEELNSVFEQWKGNLEQIDDVCIIGMKI
ncbi:MAG: tetratricopeptide repeat protein [Bacteroidota bacterium]|nr:tetratricopeptide repeat protein [Bacteroidota bacterium]